MRRLISEPIYGSEVLFLVGDIEDSRKQAAEWFDSFGGEHNAGSSPGRAEAFTFEDDAFRFAICVPNSPDSWTLAHEAIHVGVSLLGQVGIPVSRESDEALCYYVQWLLREINKPI